MGWEPAFFSEIEDFPRAVLAHHYPSVPLHGDLSKIYYDELIKVFYEVSNASTEEGVPGSDRNVPEWFICSECSGAFWSYPAVDARMAKSPECTDEKSSALREREPFLPGREEIREIHASLRGESFGERVVDATEQMRTVRQRLCICEREARIGGSPRRLQSPAESALALSNMPPRLAFEQYGCCFSSGQLDVLVGGFPCQDLSVAGKRQGLISDDGKTTRSGLFYRIAELCDTSKPRWTVLENVPGLLSSKQGRDFAAVVGTLAGIECSVPADGWANSGFVAGPKGLVEWAILDAQYFGVAQRRRRVFIVRDSGDWRSRPPLLLERESLSGDSAPSREAREEPAKTPTSSTGGGGANVNRELVAKTLTTGCGTRLDSETDTFVTAFPSNANADAMGATGNNVSPTMQAQGDAPAVAFSENQRGDLYESSVTQSLSRGGGKPGQGYQAVRSNMSVRRLTPIECERLQGFPDNFTRIPYRNKPAENCPDGPRYKALGNSMAVPVMRWIGERIMGVDDVDK